MRKLYQAISELYQLKCWKNTMDLNQVVENLNYIPYTLEISVPYVICKKL